MIDGDRLGRIVMTGDDVGVTALVKESLAAGVNPLEIVRAMQASMSTVGDRMARGEMFIPEVLFSAKAVQAAIVMLKPYLGTDAVPIQGTVLIGTVKADIHVIGKNIVAMILEANGFEVVDLGVDVAPDAFVDGVRNGTPDIVAMSALLSTTRGAMYNTVQALEEAGLRTKVKIMIGGVAVNERFAKEIGADGYAPEAGTAAILAAELIRQRV